MSNGSTSKALSLHKRGQVGQGFRKVINGILWVLITGSRWQDMPRRHCHPTTAWRRLKELEEKGIWKRALQGLLNKGYESGRLKLESIAIDATTIEAERGEVIGIDGHKKRKGTKVHAVVTRQAIPLAIKISPVNRNEALEFFNLIEAIRLGGEEQGRGPLR